MKAPTTPTPVHARRWFWRYRIALGALCIVTGIVLAVTMNRHESIERTKADRAQIAALQSEIAERRKIRDQQFKDQQLQLKKLEKLAADQVRINDTQNDIIRALLRVRENDPALFEGVVLPTVQEFNDAVNATQKAKSPSSGSKGSTSTPVRPKPKPKPRTPRPVPDTPGPTPSKPTPATPTPTTPAPVVVTPQPPTPVVPVTPVPPTPRPPIIVVPPILPPPAQPGVIVDPITGLVCRTALVCLPSLGI